MLREKLIRLLGNRTFANLLSSFVSIVAGLLVGLILMIAFKPQIGFKAFGILLKGGLQTGMYGLGNILYFMTPIIYTGLSVAFSFQTGIFNMGVTGQFTVGAITAILLGGMVEMPSSIHWLVCILAAGIAGVIWSIVPALLKANYDVNEIITTIMTNYIAMYLANELITKLWFNRPMGVSAAVKQSALMPKCGLDKLFPKTNVNIGFIIAILFCVIVYVILFKTPLGYGLRAVGFNREAGRYMGVNEKRNIIMSILLGGFIAGFGGGVTYLSSMTKTYAVAEVLCADATNAMPAALLSASNPLGVILSAAFISYLNCGSIYIQIFGYTSETVDVITSVIMYFSAFSMAIKLLLDSAVLNLGGKQRKKGKEVVSKETAPDTSEKEGSQ